MSESLFKEQSCPIVGACFVRRVTTKACIDVEGEFFEDEAGGMWHAGAAAEWDRDDRVSLSGSFPTRHEAEAWTLGAMDRMAAAVEALFPPSEIQP